MARSGRGSVYGGRPSNYGGSVGGGPPSHLLLMELKHRMLAALAKLSDRDTQQLAVEDLQKLVDVLSPEGLAMCLSCLYDTDTQQKSIVKKECVRMFAILSARHGPLLIPHLPKIVSCIVRRLKDPDTGVRDACVEAMGTIASQLVHLSPSPPSKSQQMGLSGDMNSPSYGHSQDSNSQNDSNIRRDDSYHMRNIQMDQKVSVSTNSFVRNNNQGQHLQPHLGSSNGQELNVFVKPLFDALSEQNRSVQCGAALCLARVITAVHGNPHSPSISRLCQRVCKLLTNPSFVAKTALLPVISSLCQIGAVHNQGTINSMIACVHDALESHDWATRKTAAETLICMGSSLGTQLTTFKSGTLLLLESCRFDKVKPVRDCVQDAIQTWKSLPGLDRQMASSTCSTPSANGSTESAFINNEKLPSVLKKKSAALTDKKVNARFFNKLESQNSGDWHIEVAVPRSFPSREADFNKEKDYNGQSKNNLNECKTVLKLEESSINHSSSMQKYEREDSSPNFAAEDVKDDAHTHETESSHALILRRESPDYRRSKMLDDSELSQNSQRKNMLNGSAHERSPAPSNSSDFESYQCDPISPNLKSPTADIMTNGQNNQMSLDETPKWLTVQRQLTQLEYQQANIMDLFQEFMGSSRNSMYALEARIKVLERVMEDIVDLGVPSPDCVDRYNNEKSNYFLPYQDDHYSTESNMSRNARVDGSSPGTSSVCRKVESDFMVNEPIYDSGSSSWHINGDSTARDGHWNENNSKIQCETLEDNTYRMETNLPSEPFHEEKDNETKRTLSNGRCRDSAMPNGGTKIQRACSVQENDDYTNQEQMASRRVWDRENIHAGALGNHRGSGEGPSARSVWRASKDEATLAAIRGAKEDDSELNSSSAMNKNRTVPEMSTMHAESLDKEKKMNEMIERPSNTSCCSSNVVQGVSNKVDQEGKRAYWKLWSRTMELVQSGNLECAYTEVLNSGDELMLVRLMNKTGPVLEKLSSNTANEMLQNVAILLRQHSFFDFSLPWVQQVADLVMDMGANNLDILSTVKNELIQSIQEASHMEIPNEWVGNSMNELCSILMDAWSAQGEIS